MSYGICVVGLGLMGASLAGALRGFRDARITGADALEDVCRKAERAGVVDQAVTNAESVVRDADLVIFCVYAHHIPPMVEQCAGMFREGAVVSDICGVKSGLYAQLADLLPSSVDYVGIHPMTGKERDGFDNADPAMFKNSGLILCPLPSTRPGSVELMRELAGHIGASRVAVAAPAEHDAVIAYTSDLMHIASAGLCLKPHPDTGPAFTAGAFRDCTRVADINAEAWTELLMDNRVHTLVRLETYMEGLREIRDALMTGDGAALHALLKRAGENKREMLKRWTR
ncbi:MAG: prephenate dehydrogenase [Synergistaceae bacterium]|nr:prephenate dehydrogenase [Synergistaceae bacterium]